MIDPKKLADARAWAERVHPNSIDRLRVAAAQAILKIADTPEPDGQDNASDEYDKSKRYKDEDGDVWSWNEFSEMWEARDVYDKDYEAPHEFFEDWGPFTEVSSGVDKDPTKHTRHTIYLTSQQYTAKQVQDILEDLDDHLASADINVHRRPEEDLHHEHVHVGGFGTEILKDWMEGEYAPGGIIPRMPLPADIPPGKPWVVNVHGHRAIGYRHDRDHSMNWTVAYADDSAHPRDVPDDSIVLLGPLSIVPREPEA